MSVVSIMIAGIGGQGLVLATKIISHLALAAGHDVKTGDVVGLAQRGGMVWGSVRFGDKVHSPLIPKGQADYLLALEELEGARFAHYLRAGAHIFLSQRQIYPNRVLIEKEDYPRDIPGILRQKGFVVKTIDDAAIAQDIGNDKLSNTIMLGALSTALSFSTAEWESAIKANVPTGAIDLNVLAFQRGRELM